MGVSINAVFGFGLVIPNRDWTLRDEDGEEYDYGPYEYLDELLKSYNHLEYDIAYYHEPYDVDPVVYIKSTTQDFYWVGPHSVREPSVWISEEEVNELSALAERLGIPFEPQWLLTIGVG